MAAFDLADNQWRLILSVPTMTPSTSRPRQRGWSAIGTIILVAVCVLTVLYFVKLRPALIIARGAGLVARSKAEVMSFATAISQFNIDLGRYPTNLNELISNPTNSRFIDHKERLPRGTNDGKFLDSWNRRFLYLPPTTTSTGYVATLGKDGIRGGIGEDTDHFAALPVVSGK